MDDLLVNLCNVTGEHEIHDSLEIKYGIITTILDQLTRFAARIHTISASLGTVIICVVLVNICSVKFSPDSNELLGGGSDNCLYIYDLNRRERILRMKAHDHDINTVAYAEYDNTNTILSGGDDCLCKGNYSTSPSIFTA